MATFAVEDAGGQTAEILAATPEGDALLFNDSQGKSVGLLDISNPKAPVLRARRELAGEPTSVAVTRDGRFALVAVREVNQLVVMELPSLRPVREIALGGQPDSIDVAPDGSFAAIAIENERDESRDGGAMPQAPAGWIAVVDLSGEVTSWKLRRFDLDLPASVRFATDAEPEFVHINEAGEIAVSLQENNAVAILDPHTAKVSIFDAGWTRRRADTRADGIVSFTSPFAGRREPDALKWTPGGAIVTANEGDYDLDLRADEFAGGRNFTVWARDGSILFDEGGELEAALAQAGLYPDKRSDKRGSEPEGVEIGIYDGRALLFVGLERADAVAVYDFSNERAPRLLQLLRTGENSRPEGLLAIPSRRLFACANEGNGTISLFQLAE